MTVHDAGEIRITGQANAPPDLIEVNITVLVPREEYATAHTDEERAAVVARYLTTLRS